LYPFLSPSVVRHFTTLHLISKALSVPFSQANLEKIEEVSLLIAGQEKSKNGFW